MNRHNRESRSSSRSAGRVLRGIIAAVLLIAVTAGLPWLFVVVAGSPIPARLPHGDEVISRLSHRDDGTLLLGAVKYLGWLLWALWAVLVLLEISAQIRGRPAPRIPGLDGPQRLAALLVTSLGAAVIGTSMSISRAAVLPASSLSPSVSTVLPHTSYVPPGDIADEPEEAVDPAVMTISHVTPMPRATKPAPISGNVEVSDEAHAVLAMQTSVPEQHRTAIRFAFDSAQLSRSATAALTQVAHEIREHADPATPIMVIGHTDSLGPADYNHRLSVRRAQTVRTALEQILRHGYRFQERGKGETAPIAAETRSDGHDDPLARARNRRVEITYTRAQPGTLDGAPNQSTGHRGGDDGNSTTPTPHPPATNARPTPPFSTPAPSSSAVVTPLASATPTASVTPRATDPPQTNSPTHSPSAVTLPSGATVGLSFAAGVGAALAASRLHRRRRRRTPLSGPDPNTREPNPAPVVRHLRRADLAAREGGHTDPAQAAGECDSLHVFPVASSGMVVLGVRGSQEVTVPIGGLVVGLTGPGARAAARALLLALLTHAGDHDVEIVLPRGDAARLLNLSHVDIEETARHIRALRVTPDLDVALRLLESERIHRARLLDSADGENLAAVRQAEPTEPLPRMVLVATPGEEHRRRLEALSAAADVYDMATVLLGECPAGATVHLDEAGQAIAVEADDTSSWDGLRLFHLTAEDARQVVDVIRSAHGAPEPEPKMSSGTEGSAQAPAPPIHQGSDEGQDRPAYLRVLGPPRLSAGDTELSTGIRGKARELLTYLAVHAEGATRDAILAALWPDVDQKHAVMRFHAAINDVRTALRRATGLANESFVSVRADRYRIDPELVGVDLWRFRAAIHQASQEREEQARVAHLQEAADVYEGHLAAEPSYEQPYEWIEPEREALRRQAIETLTHLARLREADEPERSMVALERARVLDRYAEEIYQHIMSLQARMGRSDAVRRTYRLLEAALEELGVDPSEESQQLLSRLTRVPKQRQP